MTLTSWLLKPECPPPRARASLSVPGRTPKDHCSHCIFHRGTSKDVLRTSHTNMLSAMMLFLCKPRLPMCAWHACVTTTQKGVLNHLKTSKKCIQVSTTRHMPAPIAVPKPRQNGDRNCHLLMQILQSGMQDPCFHKCRSESESRFGSTAPEFGRRGCGIRVQDISARSLLRRTVHRCSRLQFQFQGPGSQHRDLGSWSTCSLD